MGREAAGAPALDPVSRLTPLLRGRVAERLGWQDLRTAQKLAIAPILDGHNTLVLAPTAGGKTEAAFLPLLSALHEEGAPALSTLYVSPLKALLNNQEARLSALADMVGRTAFRWHGDVADADKGGFMREPADILMITPESLEGLFLSGCDRLFARIRAVVVDEAHAFAGTERGDHLLSLIERCAGLSIHDVQRIGLSATLGNPAALLDWLAGPSKRPRTVVDPPRGGIRRFFTLKYVEGGDMAAIAAAAAPHVAGKAAMFFTDARRLTEALRPALAALGIPVRVHHASVDHKLREEAEKSIRGPVAVIRDPVAVIRDPVAQRSDRAEGLVTADLAKGCCLLCTSTMELGVDVGDLDAVLQLDAPTTVASYLQRMGRSGRRGAPGQMIVLADDPEGFLRAIALTELARRRWVEPVQLSRRSWGPYVHQILALVVAKSTLTGSTCHETLSRCWAFSKITLGEFETLIDHLCGLGLLERVRHCIQLGFAAEKEFGDKGFAALCAVFDGGAPQVEVMAGGEAVGSIDRGFAGRLARGENFNLAGRTWQAGAVDWQRGRIEVAANASGDRGAMPSWRGSPAAAMAPEVASEIRALLVGDGIPEYLDPPEQAKLAELRELAAEAGLTAGSCPVEVRGGRMVVWTFAGERVNRVLSTALALELGGESSEIWNRFTLRLPPRRAAAAAAPDSRRQETGQSKGSAALGQAVVTWEQIARSGLSHGDRQRILAALPDRTGSRFLRYLPEKFAAEVKAAALVDFDGAVAFVSGHRLEEGGTVLPSPPTALRAPRSTRACHREYTVP